MADPLTACPCCKQPIAVPPLDDLLEQSGIVGRGAAVLRTAWAARGLPVTATALFDAIYADDPDGGPSTSRMYRELREAVAASNERLRRFGVALLHDGRVHGWRLDLQGGGR